MSVVILSPHFDDAVLSCWHVLTQPAEVEVINVFAGVPVGLDRPAWWDLQTGATDSGRRVRERVEEDRRALALAGRRAISLDLLDEQYRTAEQPLAPVLARLGELLAPDTRIYAPGAFSDHPDHALVRCAALQLRAAGFDVALYADLPHANAHGWPAWVTGQPVPVTRDLAAATWERWLTRVGVPPEELMPTVHVLAPAEHARKLEAVSAYRTQVDGLAEFLGRPLADPVALGYEVVWTLPGVPTAARAPAGSPAASSR